MLKIYKLSQAYNIGYDTYDSFVVVSCSVKRAKKYHPSEYVKTFEQDKDWINIDMWAYDPMQVKAEFVGKAGDHCKEGDIICKSFNAG